MCTLTHSQTYFHTHSHTGALSYLISHTAVQSHMRTLTNILICTHTFPFPVIYSYFYTNFHNYVHTHSTHIFKYIKHLYNSHTHIDAHSRMNAAVTQKLTRTHNTNSNTHSQTCFTHTFTSQSNTHAYTVIWHWHNHTSIHSMFTYSCTLTLTLKVWHPRIFMPTQ